MTYTGMPDALLDWYEKNKRDLPWRQDKAPYHVWLSEIMLQQTRVEAVKGYYARFLEKLPTIQALAEADDELLHKLWEGLGYYSRVRNLKKAALEVVNSYDGVFPKTYEQVLSLPGIGPYTAGAICSIAYDLPTPAVDGNVLRVVSRLLSDDTPIDAPAFRKNAERFLQGIYPKRAGDFTQALMELGATLCGPNRKPDCVNCPCLAFCKGAQTGTAEFLPVKSPKKERRQEDKTLFVLDCQGAVALQKRPAKGLLAGLWQFPNVQGILEPIQALAQLEKWGIQPQDIHKYVERKHIFTHIQWNMRAYYITVKKPTGGFVWVDKTQVETQIALPTAFHIFWES